MNSALEYQWVYSFCQPVSWISHVLAILCEVINIEFNIIVFAAACWWAILRSPSWVMMKSHQLSRTKGRNWSDAHKHTLHTNSQSHQTHNTDLIFQSLKPFFCWSHSHFSHFIFHKRGFHNVVLSVNFIEVFFQCSDHKIPLTPCSSLYATLAVMIQDKKAH